MSGKAGRSGRPPGTPQSPEARENISRGHTGVPLSDYQREMISLGHRRVKHRKRTREERKNISDSLRGNQNRRGKKLVVEGSYAIPGID